MAPRFSANNESDIRLIDAKEEGNGRLRHSLLVVETANFPHAFVGELRKVLMLSAHRPVSAASDLLVVVLGSCSFMDMARIATRAIVAFVKSTGIGEAPVLKEKRNAVGSFRFIPPAQGSVTVGIAPALPFPASVRTPRTINTTPELVRRPHVLHSLLLGNCITAFY